MAKPAGAGHAAGPAWRHPRSGIRFASPEHGFVFGDGLWETSDGGERWFRDAWTRGSILSLAMIDGQVLALADRCSVSGGCVRTTTLPRRPLSGGRCRIAAYPGAPNLMAITDSIATQGRMAAVVAGHKVLVTRDGRLSFKGYATHRPRPRGHDAGGGGVSRARESRRRRQRRPRRPRPRPQAG